MAAARPGPPLRRPRARPRIFLRTGFRTSRLLQGFIHPQYVLWRASSGASARGCGARHCLRRRSTRSWTRSEMYAVLIYLRKMTGAGAASAGARRCLILVDCKPALQAIEVAWRRGRIETGRGGDRGPVARGARRRLPALRRSQVPRAATKRPKRPRRPKKRPQTRAAVAGGGTQARGRLGRGGRGPRR